MKALITGSTSGIGYEMAKNLFARGYDLILVARRYEILQKQQQEFGDKTIIIKADLSKREEVIQVFEKVKNEEIQILINNAGFGALGEFCEVSLEKELQMIDTNVVALHILTKLFLQKFMENDSGYILNVASIASFFPGPLLATYYATKSYVRILTQSIYEELRKKGSKVYIGALCPGPVKTEFDKVADVKFSIKGADAKYVANYAIKQMFKRKEIIIPKFEVKLSRFFGKIIPSSQMAKITYHMQQRKSGS